VAKIVANGIRLNTVRTGDGPDVVLVHGLGANLAFWHLSVLRALGERFRLTVFDQRGHGYSDMPASGYAVDDMAADLGGLLDALGIERAHLVGHSYGGSVVLTYAVRHPERVRSLILADARVAALQPAVRPRDFAHWAAWSSQFRAAGISLEDQQTLDFTVLEALADPRFAEARRRLGNSEFFVPFGGWNGGRRAADRWLRLLATTTARTDFRRPHGPAVEEIRALAMPVFAMCGELSHCVETMRGLVAAVPGCRAAVCPRGGHFFPAVHPDYFAAQLLEFLGEVESDRAGGPARPDVPAPTTAPAATPAGAGGR
jgi:pimeloyl-ACP methyl ester carboxylesterase